MSKEKFLVFLDKFYSQDNREINSKFDIVTKPEEIDKFKVTTKIRIKCKQCGAEYYVEARRLLHTNNRKIKRCKNCELGVNNFLKLVKKYKLDKHLKFPKLKEEFTNLRSKITCVCKKHNQIFNIVAGSLFLNDKIEAYKNGIYRFENCPECRKEIKSKNKFSKEELIQIYKNKFDYKKYKLIEDETEFDKPVKEAKVTILCPKHGKQQYKWYHLLYIRKGNIPCVMCIENDIKKKNYERRNWTYEKIVEVARRLYGEKYKIKYFDGKKSYKDKITVVCPLHGEFESYITNFVRGNGCFKCGRIIAGDKQKKYQTKGDLENLVKKIYKYEYNSRFYLDFNKITFPLSINDRISVICTKHGAVEVSVNTFENGIYCPICISSKFESDFVRVLRNEIGYKGEILKLRKIPGSNYEIDIFLPNLKLGVELHGIFFHSAGLIEYYDEEEFNLLKWKHYKKASAAAKQNILLLQIFENEWYNEIKRKIWINIIKAKLGIINNKIYARKLNVKIYDKPNDKIREFFNLNHLHGFHTGLIYLTLEDEYNDIYSGLIIGKGRFQKYKEGVYEIIRFVNRIDYVIPGSFSRLFRHFINKISNISFVYSYIDRRINNLLTENYLTINNFKFHKTTNHPNYYYFTKLCDVSEIRLLPRQYFIKHKLKDLFENYNHNLTELENVLSNGFRVIYDAGSNLFIYK